jgi:hypothetical protein
LVAVVANLFNRRGLKMQLRRWAFIAAMATTLACSAKVDAATIHIGVDTDGAGGPITTLVTGVAGAGFAGFAGGPVGGGFTVTSASGQADPIISLPDLFQTQTVNASGAAGTLLVYITATGLTSPTGLQDFVTTLTSNTLSGATATLSAFLDNANGIFSTPALGLMASAGFGGPGVVAQSASLTADAEYSVTALYEIVFGSGGGNANLTINVAVPGPVLGAGIPGLILACGALIALARRRRKFA